MAGGLPTTLRTTEFWLRSYRRTWRGSAFSNVFGPALYLGSIGFGLGGLVDAGGRAVLGVPYPQFVAPGVLAATVMQMAVGESTYPVLGAVRWQRQYHAMLATPLGVLDVLLGHAVFIALRAAMVCVTFLAVAALFGAWRSAWVLAALPVCVLLALAHCLPVMAFAVRNESDSAFALLYRLGVVPMFLFAGTFFPVSSMAWPLRAVAALTPLFHGTTLCRDLALGRVQAGPLALHVLYLALWAGAGLAVAARCYRRRLVA